MGFRSSRLGSPRAAGLLHQGGQNWNLSALLPDVARCCQAASVSMAVETREQTENEVSGRILMDSYACIV